MAFWNYRVVRRTWPAEDSPYTAYAIHEAHYDEAERGVDAALPQAITTDAVTSTFDSVDDLRDALQRMLDSLDKPVLDYDAF